MAINSLGSGGTWTPLDRTVVHFGSPQGTTYEDPEGRPDGEQ